MENSINWLKKDATQMGYTPDAIKETVEA